MCRQAAHSQTVITQGYHSMNQNTSDCCRCIVFAGITSRETFNWGMRASETEKCNSFTVYSSKIFFIDLYIKQHRQLQCYMMPYDIYFDLNNVKTCKARRFQCAIHRLQFVQKNPNRKRIPNNRFTMSQHFIIQAFCIY